MGELPIKIKLVAPPLYVMLCSTLDKASGLKLLNDAIGLMQTEIKAAKGELQVKAAPRAVDERDDKLLNSLLSTLEQQNQEIDGDADEDEQDEGMGKKKKKIQKKKKKKSQTKNKKSKKSRTKNTKKTKTSVK